jgi:antitoxin (DNA-binding transcriptional repressor) of toxin-antitoxin stability system
VSQGFAIRAEDQPAWAEIVRRAERGESVAVIAHGDHVADVVPSGAGQVAADLAARRVAGE